MKFIAAGNTDVGRKRGHNEDALLVDNEHGVFVVADGMGGHDSGEVASAIVIQSFQSTLAAFDDPNITAPWNFDKNLSPDENLVHGCIQWANLEIHNASLEKLKNRHEHDAYMGTTVVALRIGGDKVTYAHAGDSRIYHMSAGQLVQLTKDHSYVQEMVDHGYYTQEQAENSVSKNVITRAVGLTIKLQVPVATIVPKTGDMFLLCSDGLSNELSAITMELILGSGGDVEDLVATLIQTANANGGKDNITAIVIRIL